MKTMEYIMNDFINHIKYKVECLKNLIKQLGGEAYYSRSIKEYTNSYTYNNVTICYNNDKIIDLSLSHYSVIPYEIMISKLISILYDNHICCEKLGLDIIKMSIIDPMIDIKEALIRKYNNMLDKYVKLFINIPIVKNKAYISEIFGDYYLQRVITIDGEIITYCVTSFDTKHIFDIFKFNSDDEYKLFKKLAKKKRILIEEEKCSHHKEYVMTYYPINTDDKNNDIDIILQTKREERITNLRKYYDTILDKCVKLFNILEDTKNRAYIKVIKDDDNCFQKKNITFGYDNFIYYHSSCDNKYIFDTIKFNCDRDYNLFKKLAKQRRIIVDKLEEDGEYCLTYYVYTSMLCMELLTSSKIFIDYMIKKYLLLFNKFNIVKVCEKADISYYEKELVLDDNTIVNYSTKLDCIYDPVLIKILNCLEPTNMYEKLLDILINEFSIYGILIVRDNKLLKMTIQYMGCYNFTFNEFCEMSCEVIASNINKIMNNYLKYKCVYIDTKNSDKCLTTSSIYPIYITNNELNIVIESVNENMIDRLKRHLLKFNIEIKLDNNKYKLIK